MEPLKKLASHPGIKHLGPGLITGAADDDPSGIATYSQGGAQFGFNMLWTVILTYPLMSGIQMISARLGCLTGRGLAANIKAQFPRPVLFAVVFPIAFYRSARGLWVGVLFLTSNQAEAD